MKRLYKKSLFEELETDKEAVISCPSSESDEDDYQTKKKKHLLKGMEKSSKSWIKLFVSPETTSNTIEIIDIEDLQVTPSKENNNKFNFIESCNKVFEKDESPIFEGKENTLKQIKEKIKSRREYCVEEAVSPDYSDCDKIISNSPTSPLSLSSPYIEFDTESPPETDFNETININLDSSKMFDSSLSFSSSVSQYYQPRKKKFKKGGLAFNLQKILKEQKNNYAIWNHERYLNILEDSEFLEFKVENSWTEFNCNIYNCGNFYLIVGYNSLSVNLSFENGKVYRLFPPYNSKTVTYKGQLIKCIYNGVKFISVDN